ncbi:MAG TPA: autotransporter domain-containing protein [Alphaproteobacteria bacterium]|nr:autotransporter domain-containing protein [Alphaproteobacteria bacterium]
MTLSFRKVLLASTAFVAVSASANALTTINTSTGSAATTSDSTSGILVTGTGNLTVPSGTAITISATVAGDNSITINTGGIVRSNENPVISATASPAAGNVATTITNFGSIIAGSSSPSIALSNMTNAVTLNNSGTISGSIALGSGNNVVNVSAGTITGNITTQGGDDTYRQTGGTVNGNLDFGAGTDTVNISGGTVNGNIGMGTGATAKVLNYTGGVITGTISGTGTGGAGNSTLNVSGTRVWNVANNITGFNNINISNTTVNLNNGTGTFGSFNNNLNVGTGATLNVNASTASFGLVNDGKINVSGTLNVLNGATITNDGGTTGTLNVNSGGVLHIGDKSIVQTDVLGSLGKLTIDVGTSKTAGVLKVTNGAAVLTNTSLTINVANTAGFIASGTSYSIITGSAGDASSPILTKSQQGVYTFTVSRTVGTNNVSLTIVRAATASLTDSETGKAAANVLDNLGANATGDLLTVQSTIGSQTSAAGVNNVVESLAPAVDAGVGMAAVDIGTQSNNNINDRLASLRSTALSGVATGDRVSAGHLWLQGFGNVTNQDNRKGNPGYNANTGGATAGVDTDTLIDGVTTGAAFTYGHSNVNSKGAGDAQTDIDSYMATIYGSKAMEDGYFINGQLGFAYNQFDSKRNVVGFGTSTNGDWKGLQYQARLQTGRDIAVTNEFTLTPVASAQYTLLDQESYTETGPAALRVNPDNLSALDLGAGLETAYNIKTDNGGAIRPRAHAKLNYRTGDTQLQTTSNFVAGGSSFSTNGIETSRGSVNLGAGVLLTSADGVDFSVDYDADIRNSATGHTGQVKVRWPF